MKSYSQARWNLQDLFPHSDSLEVKAAMDEMLVLAEEAELTRPTLSTRIHLKELLQLLEKIDRIKFLSIQLDGYAYLLFSDDQQDQANSNFVSQVKDFLAGISNRLLFFELWWKNLEDQIAFPLLEGSGKYRYWLESLRRFKDHTLSEPEEKIINLKNVTGSKALTTFYESFTNSYTYALEIGGQRRSLSRGEIMGYMQHEHAEIRAAAYQEHYRPFSRDGSLLGQIYQTLARDWRNEYVNLRGHRTPISARNMINDIPDQVVEAMLSVARDNIDIFQRYFRLKASTLGLKRLTRYDLLAPISSSGNHFSFEDASKLCLEAFDQFEPQFAILAERIFQEKHLDSTNRKEKSFLPYCYNFTQKTTPYINFSFQGRLTDVFTLQHELGHAIHSLLAQSNPSLVAYPCLPLAETASIFSELLLVDHLLANETIEQVRKELLFSQLDRYYSAIQRQAFTALFEMQAHEMVQERRTAAQIAQAYLQGLKAQFGNAMEIGDEFRWEWVAYPHIFVAPFYVYAYSFGQLLVLALYQRYKTEGIGFKEKFIRLLAAGGSESPMRLLEKAGINPAEASFWQQGYDVVDRLVMQLETLPEG